MMKTTAGTTQTEPGYALRKKANLSDHGFIHVTGHQFPFYTLPPAIFHAAYIETLHWKALSNDVKNKIRLYMSNLIQL